jgi:hypothetical protein
MLNCINLLNGRIRLKVPGFKESCESLGVPYIEADYNIKPNSAYLAGLVDTDGSIVLNIMCNRIELNLEFQKNEYSEKLNLSEVIPGTSPIIIPMVKRNQNKEKKFYSIRFSYNRVGDMVLLYEYFLKNRLYSNFKFYRVTSIKRFLELRPYKNQPLDSAAYKIYYNFICKVFSHLNEHKSLPLSLQSPVKNDLLR